MATVEATPEVKQEEVAPAIPPRKRGRWPRPKNKNMARGIDKSTWLTFCRKYRQNIIANQKDHFSTLSLPEKTSTMARAYRHFVTVKGQHTLPKKKEVGAEGLSPFATHLMDAINTTELQYDASSDKSGFLSM